MLEWLACGSPRPRRLVLPPEEGTGEESEGGGGAEVEVDYAASLDNAATVIARLHRGQRRLVFVDSRSRAELLTSRLRELGVTSFVTHSSLGAELVRIARASAEGIRDKYLNPPRTTDFAIMFLATEGLYAEVARRPGLLEELQRDFRVVVAGPSTFAALLNSLHMGFRTLAIQKRSSEVWKILAAVKTEFGKFGGVLGTLKKKLVQATNTIDKATVRTRAMSRKLRDVEKMPEPDARILLESNDSKEPRDLSVETDEEALAR